MAVRVIGSQNVCWSGRSGPRSLGLLASCLTEKSMTGGFFTPNDAYHRDQRTRKHHMGSFAEDVCFSRFAHLSPGSAQCTPERDTTAGWYKREERSNWTVLSLAGGTQEGWSTLQETSAFAFTWKRPWELPYTRREAQQSEALDCTVSVVSHALSIGQCQNRSADQNRSAEHAGQCAARVAHS